MKLTERKYFLSVLAAVVALTCPAKRSFDFVTPQGRNVEVSVINKNTVKIKNYIKGEEELTANRFDESLRAAGMEITPADDSVSYIMTKKATAISGGSVTVLYDNNSGSLTIYGGNGRLITDSGLRTLSDGCQEIKLTTASTGTFYGAGERGHSLNLSGDTLVMYNRPTFGYGDGDPRINQMNITMPLIVSPDGYALVFDDFAASTLILSNPIEYITESPGAISYYFINGVSTVADVVERLTEITGRQDLPPLWALGYITSKYGYKTQEETEAVVDSLKSFGYPLDGLVLDLYWYGKEQDMGRLDWDPQQWPRPEEMLARLGKKGVKVVPISQPYVLRNGKGVENYDTLSTKGLFVRDSVGDPLQVEIWVGSGGMFDVSNPDTKAWLTKRYKELTDMGVTGWWGDLGEPEQHPASGRHANGLKAREYHNKYGNDWSKIIYDLIKEQYPDRRPFLLMRGGTTGLQQYSVFPWSGDVARNWPGLEAQVKIMLNAGMSGLGYMSHDVGGFAVDEANPIDPELYVRWLQLGLFSPVLRTHSQAYAEPYHYPEYAGIIKKLIDNRYRWLPYNYTLAYENAVKGYPLVRPLNFHDGGPSGCDSISDEYLWGRDVFVAPVMKRGAVSRSIVFPLGQWIDMRNPADCYSGKIDSYDAPLDVLPIFVRAGAFIPQADYRMENTSDYDPSRLTVNYYAWPGVTSDYVLYDDDRLSPVSLDENQYRLISFKGVCETDDVIKVDITSTGTYTGASPVVDIDFRVPTVKGRPDAVKVNGKKVRYSYSESAGLSFNLKFVAGQEMKIEILPIKK